MKEITSKLTGKVQIISDDTWDELKRNGRASRYKMRNMPKIDLKKPVIIPEKKVITKKNKDD